MIHRPPMLGGIGLAAMLCALSGGAGAQTPAAMEARAAELQKQAIPYKSSEEHYQALMRQAKGRTRPKVLPDWRGLWERVTTANQQHARLPLKPDYAAQFAALRAQVKQGVEWDHLSYCLPAGYPRVNNEPFLKEFVLRADQTWIINEMSSEVRRIYTDGRGHPPADEAFPLWEGHSVGFWNGDVLVVHTNNAMAFKSGYSRSAPAQSEQLSTVEEWRKVSPDLIELVTTVYDPEVLSRPYALVNQFARVKDQGARIDQWVCNENNRVVRTAEGGTQFILPGEPGDKPPGIAGFER